jgi:hypothetical protein
VGDRVRWSQNPPFGDPEAPMPQPHETYEERLVLADKQHLRGTIVSTADDRNSEISVKWDNGETSRCLWCAKNGRFALEYA